MDPATVAEIAGNSRKTVYEHYDKKVSIDEQNHAQDQMDMLARGGNSRRRGYDRRRCFLCPDLYLNLQTLSNQVFASHNPLLPLMFEHVRTLSLKIME